MTYSENAAKIEFKLMRTLVINVSTILYPLKTPVNHKLKAFWPEAGQNYH